MAVEDMFEDTWTHIISPRPIKAPKIEVPYIISSNLEQKEMQNQMHQKRYPREIWKVKPVFQYCLMSPAFAANNYRLSRYVYLSK